MALLDYFHLVCGKDYKLFTVGDLPKSSGANVTEEEVVAIIDVLTKTATSICVIATEKKYC